MSPAMNDLILDFARRCTSLRRQIAYFDAGNRTSERTVQRPAWTDTTAQSRARVVALIENYERLVALHSVAV